MIFIFTDFFFFFLNQKDLEEQLKALKIKHWTLRMKYKMLRKILKSKIQENIENRNNNNNAVSINDSNINDNENDNKNDKNGLLGLNQGKKMD